MNETAAVEPKSAIQSGVSSLEKNIDIIDQKLGNVWDRLQPILSPQQEGPTGDDAVKPNESPLLNHLAILQEKTGKIITGFDNLLQRIQC